MELATFPTRVILMPEHGRLLPLWDRSPAPDMWFGPFERNVLGLPEELETRLVGWNDRLVSLMGANQEWSSPQERLAFIVDGHLLAADVQREFGPDVPVLYQDADEENSRVPSAEGSGDEGRPAVGVNGRSLSPSPSEHPSSEAWIRTMPDAEFAALARDVDLSRNSVS